MDVQHLAVRHLDKVQLIYKEFLTSYRIQFDPSNAFFFIQTLTAMYKLAQNWREYFECRIAKPLYYLRMIKVNLLALTSLYI